MKLVKQTDGGWQYAVNQNEFDLLWHLIKEFPVNESVSANISRTDTDPKSLEREKLLNESLAEHRKELKRQAGNLLATNKLKKSGKRHLLTLTDEEREILLQILNDIRVGCWYSLGKPETLEMQQFDGSPQILRFQSLMNIAGFFEHHLISSE